MTKQKIRSKMLLRLKRQEEKDRNRKSRIIKNKLFRMTVFKKAKTVMFYIAFGGEVKTEEMIRRAKKIGKIVCVPALSPSASLGINSIEGQVMKKDRISMRPVLMAGHAELVKGPYGVMQPVIQKVVNLQSLDMVIVPGLAFDKKGNRLGRGKGYYDRFIKEIPRNANTIGLAYDFQILPSVPTTKDDINVKKVLFA